MKMTITNLKREIKSLKDSFTAAHQVVLDIENQDGQIPKFAEHVQGFTPTEAVDKYRRLLKLGRALDETEFNRLMD